MFLKFVRILLNHPVYRVLLVVLFNNGCVVQLWSETVAVRRRMIYGLDDIWWSYEDRGRMRPKFPDICNTVEGKLRKNLNQEIDLTGDRTWARCVRSN